jgi:hypothetical protein
VDVEDCGWGGKFPGRKEGELVSEGVEGEDEGFWNNFRMSILPGFAGTDVDDEVVDAVETEVEEEAWLDGGFVEDETDDFPFIWLGVAGTEPKDFTPSDDALIAGVAAGEEDIGAEASSMDPKDTTEPVFVAPTLLRGILTPSFIGIP